MASILTARRRGPRQDEGDLPSTSPDGKEASRSFKWRNSSKTARVTLVALVLIVCKVLLPHPKLMLNPQAHGSSIIHGEMNDGFQHHFYRKSPRFVVVVDSGSEVYSPNRHNRLASIHATWGPSACAIFVVNNVTEYPDASHSVISKDSSPRDPYPYPQLLLLPPDALPDRSIASLKYTIQTVLERVNPDFAPSTNCHTYVIPDHVCHFLSTRLPSDGMYAGHALKTSTTFHPESAGYILSGRSMENLVKGWK